MGNPIKERDPKVERWFEATAKKLLLKMDRDYPGLIEEIRTEWDVEAGTFRLNIIPGPLYYQLEIDLMTTGQCTLKYPKKS